MKKKTYYVALYGIMFATIVVAMAIDKLISLGLPSGISTAACVLLVTFSFCLVQNDWLTGFFAGVFFGLASWIKAFVFGEIFTVNPLVSLLPRVFVGIVTFAVYRLAVMVFKRMSNPKARQIIAMSVAILFGLVTNTTLFLTALNMWKDFLGADYSSLFVIIKAVVYTNIIPEYLISIILVPQIVLGVRRGMHLGVEAPRILEKTN